MDEIFINEIFFSIIVMKDHNENFSIWGSKRREGGIKVGYLDTLSEPDHDNRRIFHLPDSVRRPLEYTGCMGMKERHVNRGVMG